MLQTDLKNLESLRLLHCTHFEMARIIRPLIVIATLFFVSPLGVVLGRTKTNKNQAKKNTNITFFGHPVVVYRHKNGHIQSQNREKKAFKSVLTTYSHTCL